MATFFSVLSELISAIGMLGVGLGVLFFGVAMFECVKEFELEMKDIIHSSEDKTTDE